MLQTANASISNETSSDDLAKYEEELYNLYKDGNDGVFSNTLSAVFGAGNMLYKNTMVAPTQAVTFDLSQYFPLGAYAKLTNFNEDIDKYENRTEITLQPFTAVLLEGPYYPED